MNKHYMQFLLCIKYENYGLEKASFYNENNNNKKDFITEAFLYLLWFWFQDYI